VYNHSLSEPEYDDTGEGCKNIHIIHTTDDSKKFGRSFLQQYDYNKNSQQSKYDD
jgi:hypothetical protein